MFIGHFGPALAAAAHEKAPPLPVLLIAAQLTDFAFFGFVLADVEAFRIIPGFTALSPFDLYHMPYTHSLLGTVVWAAGFAILTGMIFRSRVAGLLGGAVVLSHWLLDLLTHVPDLTLAGRPPLLGLGLWDVPAIAIPLEIGVFVTGLWLYARGRPAISRRGSWLLGGFGVLLLAAQLVNWFGGAFPDSADAGAQEGLLAFTVIALLGWAVSKWRAAPAASAR
ncbi:hypothetical protein KCG44_02850 [Pacificimonas sp. WHA3]|uniref:Metal-dependent hydrolase n=1 Tax=Pacificimonas pallii TaxID=2827236 RepID=A0ABS6SBW7_9SPHN|nr:hypothetical protein [Pacificimonas pallii]MBV7255720.1 hypothetical protein [Pacificimonas pallii]